MNKKNKLIILGIVLVIVLLGIYCGVYFVRKNNKPNYAVKVYNEKENVKKLTKTEKAIAGLEEEKKNIEDDKKTFSDMYKDYLKLSDEEKEESEVIPDKQDVPFEKLKEIQEEQEKEEKKEEKKEDKKEEKEIPEKFDLRDKIDINVDDQQSYGLCWDFASLNALETHLALKNLGNYDFSELHLDYVESELLCGYRTVHEGGSFNNFKAYNIESGVVLESEVPYVKDSRLASYKKDEYDKFLGMDVVVPVTETVSFPTLYKGEYNEFTDEEIKEYRDTVKKHIMTNGGLYCCIAAPTGNEYYNSKTSAIYYPSDADFSIIGFHAVTIIGWDDNYSKDNFIKGVKPKNDGAYIALNSWGKYANDDGYIYISYEDRYAEGDLNGIISTSMENAYKISAIKNKEIREYLEENYGHLFVEVDGEKYITKNAISSIRTVDLSNRNMSSLEGIEIFSNTYEINLSNNNITDITPVKNLTSLYSIDLSNNKIKNVSPLANLSDLYHINLSNNNIKDISPISKIKNDFIELDVSNNVGITGYEKLKNVEILYISGCGEIDINKIAELPDLWTLDISNTKKLKNIESFKKVNKYIYSLNLSNCNLKEIPEFPKDVNIEDLDISKNNITDLKGIEKLQNIHVLDVSENKIKNWEPIKEIIRTNDEYVDEDYADGEDEGLEIEEYIEDEYYDEEDYMNVGLNIVANNCGIEDITVFNNIFEDLGLELKDNNIKDVSKFENSKNTYINLSNNKNITGLESLKNVKRIFLNNCNLSDINELLKLEEVSELSLEDNNITDMSDFSKFKNLSALSLAGNKELKGEISSDKLYILNLSNCGLDDSINFKKVPNLDVLNISENNITKIYEILKSIKTDYLQLCSDKIDFDSYVKIKSTNNYDNRYITVDVDKIELNYTLLDNKNEIDINSIEAMKADILKDLAHSINIENGKFNKSNFIITIDDIEKESIKIRVGGYASGLYEKVVEIIYNSNTQNAQNIENSIDDNIDNNTVVNNEIVNNNVINNNIGINNNAINNNTRSGLNNEVNSINNSIN